MHRHSGAHNYLFKHSAGYFFCISSKSTEPVALQTMCLSTFGILKFTTMRAPPEQNTEEQTDAFQPAALTYRKPLSRLPFANQQKDCWACACICACVCIGLIAGLYLVCLDWLNCFHACMGVRRCKCIHLRGCMLCVCLHWYICMKQMQYMLVYCVCVCVRLEASVMVLQRSGFFTGWDVAADCV